MSIILSIIVPVYNSGKYLRDCLNSISDQSFKDFECILVDDGSSDESPIICDEYASADPRFFCIHKKNEGALSARFEGLKKASSKFVSFIDSDDFIEADMYETLMGELSKNKADIICSGHYVYESSNSSPLQYLNIAKEGVYEGKTLESLTENILHGKEHAEGVILMSLCGKVYKKNLIFPYIESLPKNLRIWEDIAYSVPPFMDAERIEVLNKCFYHYRYNEDSVTKSKNCDGLFDKTLYSLACAEKSFLKFSPGIKLGFYRKAAQILSSALWDYCDQPYAEAKKAFDKALDSDFFKKIVKTALDDDNIRTKYEKPFLTYLSKGRLKRAFVYRNFIVNSHSLVKKLIGKT